MTAFEPRDPDFEHRVRASFGRQRAMVTLGITMVRVEPGAVDLEMPYREDLTQQHGFVHAGVVTALVDTACGYAALTLMEPGRAVLSVEYKVNLVAPAVGERFVARGRVKKAGRTLTVSAGDVVALGAGEAERLVATMLATMMSLEERPGLTD